MPKILSEEYYLLIEEPFNIGSATSSNHHSKNIIWMASLAAEFLRNLVLYLQNSELHVYLLEVPPLINM